MLRLIAPMMMMFSAVALMVGCSSGPTAEELGLPSPEVQNANSVRQDLEGLRETLHSEGPKAVASSAESVVENVAAVAEDPASSANADTYQKIADGVGELAGLSSKGDIESKLDELTALADGLPK